MYPNSNKRQEYSKFGGKAATEDEHFANQRVRREYSPDSVSTNPDSVETEAESISRRSQDSLAAAVGDDIVNSFLKSSVLHRYSDDIREKSQKNAQQSVQSAYTAIKADTVLQRAKETELQPSSSVSRVGVSSGSQEPWISSMERRNKKSQKGVSRHVPAMRRAVLAPEIVWDEQSDGDTGALDLSSDVKPIASAANQRRAERGAAGARAAERGAPAAAAVADDDAEDDEDLDFFNPAATSLYELEGFLEQEEELQDALRRRNRHARLAFATKVRRPPPPRPAAAPEASPLLFATAGPPVRLGPFSPAFHRHPSIPLVTGTGTRTSQ